MKYGNYLEIPLEELSSNPRNPRKRFAGPGFDELVASVKEKGVIEPIIVRPRKAGGYEIVAGERRLRASLDIGLKTIPAIVRELTDEQAFDFMLIENLQREDLTEAEEAQSFQLYVGRHGEKGTLELAGRTGISPRYIRRRMAVLHLPEYVLEGWRKGKLKYGHLEQFLRVKDAPAKVKELFRLAAVQEDRWTNPATVEELKRRIDSDSPGLGLAYFPITPEGCEACPKNSMVQRDLFGIDDAGKSRCLDPACFKKKQNDWLLARWKESPPGKKYGTSGFRFQDKVGYNEHETVRYHFPPDEKCKACPHFLTIIDATGEPIRGDEQECFNKACLRSRIPKARGETTAKGKKERKPGEPRVSWHGEYFRDAFLMKRLPDLIPTFNPDDEKVKTLLLVGAIHGNDQAKLAVQGVLGIKDPRYSFYSQAKLDARILKLSWPQVKPLIREAIKAIILEGQIGGYSGFGTASRYLASRFLGVDLGKEWAMTEDYLQKKTKAEILGLGVKLKIFADPKAKDYLQRKLKGRGVGKLKKGELVDLVLKSGVELTGKVPDEILKEAK
jgi:ParB/RepB/Spo0J family partition protein